MDKLPLPKPARVKPKYSPQAQQQMQLAFSNLPALLAKYLKPQPQPK